MNLVLLTPDDFTDEHHVRFTDRRAQHIRAVHHAKLGDTLRVGLLNDQIGTGLVTRLTDAAVEIEVALDQPPPPPLPLTLLLALPRPKSLKRIVQAVTSMGVKRVILVNTWRVEKSFWDSPALKEPALREQMILGLEQARDTILPVIAQRRRFRPFVEDEIPALVAGTLALLAHPATEEPCPRDVQQPVTLAVGPEGGFIPYETDMLRQQGFRPVSLGPRRLRVEHAVPALLGRLF
ncbi:MAG: 16S rRNA (uracil(1498)-N(3))-methyltransferase [Acidobacteria bacterium RBG_16_68_9]|nr:MAG: 16S rRNA (uracil(1498)-N(3))-methyltransferase [Acidobacteria bacterium RBG_16_68_9]